MIVLINVFIFISMLNVCVVIKINRLDDFFLLISCYFKCLIQFIFSLIQIQQTKVLIPTRTSLFDPNLKNVCLDEF